jgi:hypothetical protein
MTLHIIGIDADPPTDRFWTSAGDLLSSIVSVQPTYAQVINAVIAGGGDIEITAHNDPDRITVTLVESSGLRQVVFDSSRQTITQQKAA